jgi:hypothetical protein
MGVAVKDSLYAHHLFRVHRDWMKASVREDGPRVFGGETVREIGINEYPASVVFQSKSGLTQPPEPDVPRWSGGSGEIVCPRSVGN